MENNVVETLIPSLIEKGLIDFVILEPQDDFNKAVVGYDEKQNRLIYDYEKIVEAIAESFLDEERSLESAYNDALEWVNFNTLRSVPYMGKYRPIIISWDYDTETHEELEL
tara:strand:+ start:5451 stop:5783 length:333 start_codon:yes stop_codon:yes gene_type:complete